MKIILTAAAIIASLFVSAPAAAAQQTDDCVNHAEAYAGHLGTMSDLQTEWDTKGRVTKVNQGGKLVQKEYDYCANADDFVLVFYARNVRGEYMAQIITVWRFGL